MSDRALKQVLLREEDLSPEKLSRYADLCLGSSYAAIHPTFLRNPENSKAFRETWPEIAEALSTAETTSPADSVCSRSENKPHGQNKKRKTNLEAMVRARSTQLCQNIAAIGSCDFPDCKLDHNIEQRLATIKDLASAKEEPNCIDGIDVTKYSVLNDCPNAIRKKPCPYGLNCVANPLSHCDPETGANMLDGKCIKVKPAPESKYMSNNDLTKLVREKGLHKRLSKPAISEPRPWNTELDSAAVEYVNEMRRKLKAILKDKLALAPLTTVGNMPFRRLCISQGCDVTNSEMVLATSICQLKKSELALMRRHPSERYFGLQIASGFADCVEQAIDILNASDLTYDWLDLNAGCPIEGMQNRGSGCFLLSKPKRLSQICQTMTLKARVPVTLKTRAGTITKDKNITHTILHELMSPVNGLAGIALHGRTAKQRYSKSANWKYIGDCKKYLDYLHCHNGEPQEIFPDITQNHQYHYENLEIPTFIGNGDIIDYEQYNQIRDTVDTVMIGRGALIKPWIFREIKEQRRIDLTAGERLTLLQTLARYGLELWGSDSQGVEKTRRFFLEELSFFHRYIPLGIMEKPSLYGIQLRPPAYVARNELETLLASDSSRDWVRISEMFLGKVDEEFSFIPKHKSAAY